MVREIILIDEQKCDGCGECVPACAEGAIQIIKGKARLVSDRFCDGMGACLGHCPQGALRVVRRDAEDFDEEAVIARGGQVQSQRAPGSHARPLPIAGLAADPPGGHGCPSQRFNRLAEVGTRPAQVGAAYDAGAGPCQSELAQWPVQLQLLPPTAPVFRGARLLLAADCVPFALPGFHEQMLRGRALAIACPKLDNTGPYLDKLTELIRLNDLAQITVAHMEVPCCTGLLHLALTARRMAGSDVPIEEVVVSIRGEVLDRKRLPAQPGAAARC